MKKKEYKYNHTENKEIGNKVLPGESKKIAEITGYSQSYIKKILTGNRTNKKIMEVAKELVMMREIVLKKNYTKAEK